MLDYTSGQDGWGGETVAIAPHSPVSRQTTTNWTPLEAVDLLTKAKSGGRTARVVHIIKSHG